MLKSSLCDYIDAYILAKETITITGAGTETAGRNADKWYKHVILKYCAPFTDCISKVNNTQLENAKDLDALQKTWI